MGFESLGTLTFISSEKKKKKERKKEVSQLLPLDHHPEIYVGCRFMAAITLHLRGLEREKVNDN